MTDEPGLRGLLKKMRYDTTAIQAKITDALAMLDALGVDQDHPTRTQPNMPLPPERAAAYVAGLIRNRVVTEYFELEQELDRAGVPEEEREPLRAQFELAMVAAARHDDEEEA